MPSTMVWMLMAIEVDDVGPLLERLNQSSKNTLMATLGIVYTDAGAGFLEATMPVNPNVHQPMGILHGGATAALAESVGSAASALLLDLKTHYPVGLELSINHIRSLQSGVVRARADIVHQGRTTHLWNIAIHDEAKRQIAWARLSMMVLARAGKKH